MALVRTSRPDAVKASIAHQGRRGLRIGAATLAAAVAGATGVVVPGFAPEAAASDTWTASHDVAPAAPSVLPTGPGSVSAFDRSAAVGPSVDDRAADAPAENLVALDDDAVARQVAAGIAARDAAMAATAAKIRAEADRQAKAGNFLRPTDGGVGSKFGPRKHPILGYVRLHAGWDIGGACGQPILAALPGTVTLAATAGQSGNYVKVDHGTVRGVRLETSYQHMNEFTVKAGDKVTRGQVLGSVGNTGLSTACHLHFGVVENGSNADPAKYLKG